MWQTDYLALCEHPPFFGYQKPSSGIWTFYGVPSPPEQLWDPTNTQLSIWLLPLRLRQGRAVVGPSSSINSTPIYKRPCTSVIFSPSFWCTLPATDAAILCHMFEYLFPSPGQTHPVIIALMTCWDTEDIIIFSFSSLLQFLSYHQRYCFSNLIILQQ